MPFLTKLFGVTFSDADRNLAREQADIEEITQRSLLLQANSAAKQRRPLARGTHAKGVCVLAQFEVFDVAEGRNPVLAARLAKGMFAKPGVYPATVRFGNADPKKNSDFKADVRSLSFSVDLTREGTVVPEANTGRQDFSMQNTTTLPINDSPAFLAIMKLLTASNPAAGLLSLSSKDKLRVIRTLAMVQVQSHQAINPYQQLRYGSRLQDELIRHVQEDSKMSTFDFGVQFLDTESMTYRGKHHDASFWIENASVEWKESEAPFHNVARLTLLRCSHLGPEEAKAVYFDVTENSSSDSTPVGSINRARSPAEKASRKARMAATQQV